MKDNMSTNQEIVNVTLVELDGCNRLIFDINTSDNLDGISVNMDNEAGQLELTKVFSILLEKMLEKRIKLNLSITEGYKANLYKEVCEEYIKDLNKEIDRVYEHIASEINEN